MEEYRDPDPITTNNPLIALLIRAGLQFNRYDYTNYGSNKVTYVIPGNIEFYITINEKNKWRLRENDIRRRRVRVETEAQLIEMARGTSLEHVLFVARLHVLQKVISDGN